MTRILTIVSLVLATSVLAAAGPEDAVREAGAGWRQGAIKQDKALLEKYLADDLVYTHGGGQTETKAQYIANVLKGPSHYQAMKESDVRIRFFGDKTAVLWGLVDVTPAKGDTYRVRTLEVYTQNNGVWQMSQKESVRVAIK